MKTIGLIGGMSWESTTSYYQQINLKIKQELGGFHSAKIILYSVDFAEIEQLQVFGKWDEAAEVLSDIAVKLEQAGADAIALCTNTMHKVAEQIRSSINIPFIHIADATGQKILQSNIHKVALLGTAFTMQQDFYSLKIQHHNIDVMTPDIADQDVIHQVIYDELCLGIISEQSKEKYKKIIEKQIRLGAEGIIFGCTEIGLLVGEVEFSVPVFDTTMIHVDAIVEFILNQ